MKTCRTCGQVKPLDQFYAYPRGKYGVMAQCKPCKNARSRADYSKNKDAVLQKTRAYYAANKEKHKVWSREWRQRNIEKSRAHGAIAYRNASPKRKQQLRESFKLFWVRHPEKRTEMNARIRLQRRAARVPWANQFFIDEIYHLARIRTKALGIVHHVDHVVPIKSNLVCGLHNEFNLQVLPKSENYAKGNRWWPQMP